MLTTWLPGTSDTKNYGLGSSNWTNNGVTIVTGGELGNCMNFNGSSYISTNTKQISSSTFTILAWVYMANVSGNKCLMCCRNGTNKSLAVYFIGSNIRIDTGTNWSTGVPLNATTWTHIAITSDGVTQKLFIDGKQRTTRDAETDASTITNFTTIGAEHQNGSGIGTYFNGRINDFRIYDTALSPREIKEISKGLVLHYPLSGIGQKNYIDTVTIASVPSNGSTSIIEDGVKTNGLNKDTYFVIKLKTNLVAGTTYILSFYAEGMTDGSALNFGLGAQSPSSTQYCGLVMVHNGFNTHVFTPNVAFSGQIIMDDTNRNGLPIVNMKYFKIEEGDIATPWCVSENDPRYTIMGMSDEIEYDVSGYSHNGTKTNTEFSSDTPRNIESLYFNGTSFIQANPLSSEVKTISVWCKTTKNKSTSQFICQDSASGLCVTFYKGTIISHLGGSSSTGSKCTLGDSYIENGWNHFVVLKTGTHTREVYCNGVKLTPTSNDYWSASTGFFVGARNASKTNPFYGYISDLRAYTTLLSEEDIMELYQVGASLANNGVLMAHEFIE